MNIMLTYFFTSVFLPIVLAIMASAKLFNAARYLARLKRRVSLIQRLVRISHSPPQYNCYSVVRRHESTSIVLGKLIGPQIRSAFFVRSLQKRLHYAHLHCNAIDLIVFIVLTSIFFSYLSVVFFSISFVISVIICIGVTFVLFYAYIAFLTARRTKAFLMSFPEALDLITCGIKSGLPVIETMYAVARDAADPISEVFKDVVSNIKLGMSHNEALHAAAEKLPLQEFKFFVVSLVIQQETGGNLAEVLSNLSKIIRQRNQMRLKIKSLCSEARASAVIIGALPIILIIIIYFTNRNYLMKLLIDHRGLILTSLSVVSMLIGFFIIHKMTKLDT